MSDTLDKVFEVLKARKVADPSDSYVASLYNKGTAHICGKVLEEAQEAVEEALAGKSELLKSESADLLFHLMVLWADQEIVPQDVMAVLEKRFGISGHTEKAGRKT